MNKKLFSRVLCYLLVSFGALVMIYPLIWLFFASFKSNEEIFSTASSLLPAQFQLNGYINGWRGTGQYTFATFFSNTFKIVIPMVFFSVVSSAVVAYGYARFVFIGKKLFFGIMICTMMLPSSVVLIPRYVMFRNMGWLDTYLPFIMPCVFAGTPFFVFMLIQFFRGIPRELDESAYMDGCNSLRLFVSIILPLSKPALFSVAMFQFMWAWNDFFNPLIYINSVNRYPLALALRMTMDVNVSVNWDNILAMALLSITPMVMLFFFAQRYFVEGVATTGMKG